MIQTFEIYSSLYLADSDPYSYAIPCTELPKWKSMPSLALHEHYTRRRNRELVILPIRLGPRDLVKISS